MRVVVSMNHDPAGRDFIKQNYVTYLEQLGLAPILVPNTLADVHTFVTAVGAEGIVLSGGGDVAPERYGQPNTASKDISPARDETEYRLLELAVERRLPVFGICRGIQVLNVFFGGGLIQDIPAQLHSPIPHDGEATHPVTIGDPRVERVVERSELQVNSYHHQGITADLLAPDLEVFAVSEVDGVIEGVLHRTLPVIGVQWHPERSTPSRESDERLIRWWLEQGTFWIGKTSF
jgi:putative glutamine amidotransferase